MIVNMLNEMRQKEFYEWSLLHYFIFTFIIMIGMGGSVCMILSFVLKAAGVVSWTFVFVSFVCAIIGLPCFFFVTSGKW